MAEPTTATYLSIGEVLGLLLEEFPDITISKIRFLESQGLIEPERTPSGYRKFFDDDVELLRLILREQREHFLPLRVIKDRLDSGQIEPDPTPPRGAPQASGNGAAAAPRVDRDRTKPAARPRPADLPAEPAAGHDDDAVAPEVRDTPPEPAAAPGAPEASADTASGPGPRSADEPSAASVAKHPAATRPPERPSATPPQPTGAEPSVATVDPAPAPEPDPETRPQAPRSNTQLLPGVMLSREELCAMASITDAQLAQLEEYGVIARPTGAGELYGEDAVEVAAAAGGFMRAGVDARHLRGWRNSVDREVGLYEQLVLPVLRQRNPQARAQVAAQLQELDALGARLRSAMMRAALRRYRES